MIYNDKYCLSDREDTPHDRGEDCLNCGKLWLNHYGWSCATSYGAYHFRRLPPDQRYLTQSMKDSIYHQVPRLQELSKILKFVTKQKYVHECPCGIAPQNCTYHKE